MPTSSLEELKGQISTGEYTIDSRELAGEIVAKFDLIRRVGRRLIAEGAADDAARGTQAGNRRRARYESRPFQARRQRLS